MRNIVIGAAGIAVMGLSAAYLVIFFGYNSINSEEEEITDQAIAKVGPLKLIPKPEEVEIEEFVQQERCKSVVKTVSRKISLGGAIARVKIPEQKTVRVCENISVPVVKLLPVTLEATTAWVEKNEEIQKEWNLNVSEESQIIAEARREKYINDLVSWSQIIAGFGFPISGLLGFLGGILVTQPQRSA